MKRNYDEVIAEYDEIFADKEKDAIYSSDLENIRNNNHDLFGLVCNALKYGYVMGYKAGRRRR